MEQRRNAVKQSVEVAYGILEDRAKLAKDANSPLKMHRIRRSKQLGPFATMVRSIFWINDLGKPVPKMIMHPTVPSLDGKVLDDSKFNKATSMQEGLDGTITKLGQQEPVRFIQ